MTSQLRKRDKTFDSAFALSREVFDIGPLSLPELARRTWREVMDDDLLGLAAQLSYYFFLALFSGDFVPTRPREFLPALEHHR